MEGTREREREIRHSENMEKCIISNAWSSKMLMVNETMQHNVAMFTTFRNHFWCINIIVYCANFSYIIVTFVSPVKSCFAMHVKCSAHSLICPFKDCDSHDSECHRHKWMMPIRCGKCESTFYMVQCTRIVSRCSSALSTFSSFCSGGVALLFTLFRTSFIQINSFMRLFHQMLCIKVYLIATVLFYHKWNGNKTQGHSHTSNSGPIWLNFRNWMI